MSISPSPATSATRPALQKLPSLRSTQSVRIRPYSRPEGWTWALDKTAGAYRGRLDDTDRNAGIAGMLRSGMSWTAIQAATGAAGDRRQDPRYDRVGRLPTLCAARAIRSAMRARRAF